MTAPNLSKERGMNKIEFGRTVTGMKKIVDIAENCMANHVPLPRDPTTVRMKPKADRQAIAFPAGLELGPYTLGRTSLKNLEGVHPDLVWVVGYAIKITEQDFTITDGLRTKDEQAEYVRRGVAQTMLSKHLIQEDGWGHAVDLVPWINGKARWELPACYKIMEAMRRASFEHECLLRWGGAWVPLYRETPLWTPHRLVAAYVERKRQSGKPAFIDGPHYEKIS